MITEINVKIVHSTDQTHITPSANNATGGAAKAESRAATTAPVAAVAPTEKTTVTLSSGLSDIKAGLSSDDAFDTKRVNELKAAIADGSYKIDAEKIADKLIASNTEALNRSKP